MQLARSLPENQRAQWATARATLAQIEKFLIKQFLLRIGKKIAEEVAR